MDADDRTVGSDDIWEEQINLHWDGELRGEDLIRQGRKEVKGLAIYERYCIEK